MRLNSSGTVRSWIRESETADWKIWDVPGEEGERCWERVAGEV